MVGTSLKKTFDVASRPRGHSLHIYLRPIRAGGVARTEDVGDGVLADLDKGGCPLGVELLGAKAVSRLFSLVGKDERFNPVRELAPKKRLLARMIA
ncbi:MAG: DUF2283 domain-containing protein [Planctomycetes bacterium]|nr:DUF2283 domain-containing protein [Planctomycetota bacterium]